MIVKAGGSEDYHRFPLILTAGHKLFFLLLFHLLKFHVSLIDTLAPELILTYQRDIVLTCICWPTSSGGTRIEIIYTGE